MKTKEDVIDGLKCIKNFLNGRYHKGLYEQVIEECEDEDYKIRAKKNNLASELYKADMDTLAEAVKIIESLG